MDVSSKRELARGKRHFHIRKKVRGTAERPRLCVHRSLKHIHAQVVDDVNGVTIVAASSTAKEFTGYSGNIKGAEKLGELISRRALEKGIKQVVFDRGGYLYHGRVKALAEAARKAGLEF